MSSLNAQFKTKAKRSNFSAADDYALSLAWTSVSRTTLEQDLDAFWNNVALKFNRKKQINEIGTPGSLKTRWVVVQRVTRKYIAAEKLYRSQMRSGETEDMVEDKARQVYCDRNDTTKNGVKKTAPVIKFMEAVQKTAPVIKFMEAVRYLKVQPKFSSAIGGSASRSDHGLSTGRRCGSTHNTSRSPSVTDPTERASCAAPVSKDMPSGSIPMSGPAFRRPSGVKLQRLEADMGSKSANVALSITEVGEVICFSARAKANAIIAALELMILRTMCLLEKEYNQRLEALLRRTQQLQHVPDMDSNQVGSTTNKTEGLNGFFFDEATASAKEKMDTVSTQNTDSVRLDGIIEGPLMKK